MRKTYKHRLFPTNGQAQALDVQLGEACRLYNAALQERRDAYQNSGVSLTYYDQANQVKAIRQAGSLDLANYSACQDILRRVEKTFKAFFRRVKAGQKAGYPRFKSRRRFDSYTFPSYGDGCRLPDARLYLQGVGHIKVKLHRPVDGVIKTITIQREYGKWYVCFSVEGEATPLPETDTSMGLDMGLTACATLADGTEIDNPRCYQRGQATLRRAQRRVARRKRGGKDPPKSRAPAPKGSRQGQEPASGLSTPGRPHPGQRLWRDRCRGCAHQGAGQRHARQVRQRCRMVGVHRSTGLQSGRSWSAVGVRQPSRHESDLSLWRSRPEDTESTLAPVS
jgi:transposase